jgi:hypothetical protein
MSRPRGGYIGFNRVPASGALNSAASGVWTLREAEALRRAGTWPGSFVNPLSISGLQLWLDGADASTLYDATTGGSLVAADGAVARWEDKSGNGRHATQDTSGNRPSRKAAIQNGLDVLRFDGSNDFFSLSAATTTSSYTSFFVFRRTSAGIHSVSLGPATESGNYAAWWFSDNFVYESSRSVIDFTTHGSANTSTGAFALVTTRTGTTSIATRRNGSTLATVTSGAGVTNPASGSWTAVGRGDNAPTTHNGDMCEVILYDSALSDANRALVENYLLAKWAIT